MKLFSRDPPLSPEVGSTRRGYVGFEFRNDESDARAYLIQFDLRGVDHFRGSVIRIYQLVTLTLVYRRPERN